MVRIWFNMEVYGEKPLFINFILAVFIHQTSLLPLENNRKYFYITSKNVILAYVYAIVDFNVSNCRWVRSD